MSRSVEAFAHYRYFLLFNRVLSQDTVNYYKTKLFLEQVNVSLVCGFEFDPQRASSFSDFPSSVIFLHYLCLFSVW